jgi:hypothetical protein
LPTRRAAARSRHTGADAELDLGLAEFRQLAGDAQVARHRQLAPAAEGKAVHCGDDRLPAALEPAEHRLALQRAGLAVDRALARDLGNVGTGHERLGPRAGHDHATDVCFVLHPLDRLAQLPDDGGVERVEFVGAVNGDAGDAVGEIEEQGGEGHGGLGDGGAVG